METPKTEKKQNYLIYPYSAFSIPLVDNVEAANAIESHILLAQVGKKYKNGQALSARHAILTNQIWTDLLQDKDEVGLLLHRQKIDLTWRYIAGLRSGDFKSVRQTLQQYMEIRDALCRRWFSLAIDAEENIREVPDYAKKYAAAAFHSGMYKIVGNFYKRHGDKLRDHSLYTWGPISDWARKGEAAGIVLFPLGAGGPGTSIVAVSEHGTDYIRNFFETNGIYFFEEQKALAAIHGSDEYKGREVEVKGHMPFKIGNDGIQLHGLTELKRFGMNFPEAPQKGIFNQKIGRARKVSSEEIINAFDPDLVDGLFFATSLDHRTGKPVDFRQGEPLDRSWIESRLRMGSEKAREILRYARDRKIKFIVEARLRGLDGCGSSLDLPAFQTI
ncbi:MAG: hypothetical protein M1586_02320 [Patescibacteria group bacterium]|nr:hypothetical protein [Patescibacteria group bacterium]MCL5262109.1 hypothetical protein [Patescibacteria group bacterium]